MRYERPVPGRGRRSSSSPRSSTGRTPRYWVIEARDPSRRRAARALDREVLPARRRARRALRGHEHGRTAGRDSRRRARAVGRRTRRPAACWPTGAPRWSRSSRRTAIRSAACTSPPPASSCRRTRRSSSTTAASAASCSNLAHDGGAGASRTGCVERADVFVTNMRVAALGAPRARLGRAWRRATRVSSTGCVTGYGERGPDADRPSYDVGAFWSRAGIAAALTPPGGEPPFQRGAMGDHTAGMTLAGGISAALLARERTRPRPARDRRRSCASASTSSAGTPTPRSASASRRRR